MPLVEGGRHMVVVRVGEKVEVEVVASEEGE